MSASPDVMRMMLMQGLMQQPQQSPGPGGQMYQTNPLQAAGQLVQKVMLMRALQQPQQQSRLPQTQLPQTTIQQNNPALYANSPGGPVSA